MIAGIASLLAAVASPCTPVAGADRLWSASTRWVIVGEIHGTNEMPDAFANLVCLAAASGRPVTVALEYSADWQPVVDAYLAADGGATARAALLSLPIWHGEVQDGRSSVAVLRLFERLRAMKQAGMIAGVVCSDVGRTTPAGQTRDAAMAQAWTAIRTADNGLVLAFAGNGHAMRHPVVRPTRTIVMAGSLMPPARTMTVNLVPNGGTTWDCEADGCGEHHNGVEHKGTTGIVYSDDAADRWSATYELGRPTTMALPAIPASAGPANRTPIHIAGN